MQLNNVRRSAFIAPFGPGALQVLRDGVSVLTAGLDHWMHTNGDPNGSSVDVQEFQIREWRLEKQLGVDYFLQPPDFRPPPKFGALAVPNACLTIPVLRFPTWYVCRFCNRMVKKALATLGRVDCPQCSIKRRVRMSQVRFVALCDQGHLQDFPWLEWVHRSAVPTCSGPIYFEVNGSGLGDIRIGCKGCGQSRRMEQITTAASDGSTSYLSSNLLNSKDGTHNGLFLCRGCRPWLGTEDPSACPRPLRGALRSATNVHYSEVRSAIYLPSALFTPTGDTSAVLNILREPVFSPSLAALKLEPDMPIEEAVPRIRKRGTDRLKSYADADIAEALYALLDRPSPSQASAPAERTVADDDMWIAFRRTEFNVLMREQNESDLVITPAPAGSFSTSAGRLLSAVHLVAKLRETRVFAGFTRIIAGGPPDDAGKIAALRSAPPEEGARWLPAYCVYGEGIFITLNETALQAWEQKPDVRMRAALLNARHIRSAAEHNRPVSREVSARKILLHTLSHVLINRLNYECGYSSASLRERIYVSPDKAHPMAGILIYTSSGDSEGTLGGLVRMGRPEEFERILIRAIEGSRWCSADPVCMESADQGGQGLEGLNGAACHSCALLPETSCEEFNRLLDRGLLIGSFGNPSLGFFT